MLLTTAGRNATCDGLTSALNSGYMVLYTQTPYGEAITLYFGNPAFGAAVNGTATANVLNPTTVQITGNLYYTEMIRTSDNLWIVTFLVGVPGSGKDFIVNDVDVVSGETFYVDTITITVPAS